MGCSLASFKWWREESPFIPLIWLNQEALSHALLIWFTAGLCDVEL
jgi:hypothetical protein